VEGKYKSIFSTWVVGKSLALSKDKVGGQCSNLSIALYSIHFRVVQEEVNIFEVKVLSLLALGSSSSSSRVC